MSEPEHGPNGPLLATILTPDTVPRVPNEEAMTTPTPGSPQQAKPRIFVRQRQLLTLLDALGGRVGNLDFQKLLFLYCQEPGIDAFYEFVPYRFGAFSFTSYADRRKLTERGYLAGDEKHWRLVDAGRAVAGQSRDLQVSAFAQRHRGLRGDALVAETYRRWPYYATRSEIAERVLRGDDAALEQIEAARPRAKPIALATIGYEGRTLENYLNVLLRASVTLLCDVRKNPISRKYGFSKKALAAGCQKMGIRYEHVPDLGITSDKRRNLDSQSDYDELFADYEANSLPKQKPALAKIRQWIREGQRVALTCYERLPEQCHRHCVADALRRGAGRRLVTKHL